MIHDIEGGCLNGNPTVGIFIGRVFNVHMWTLLEWKLRNIEKHKTELQSGKILGNLQEMISEKSEVINELVASSLVGRWCENSNKQTNN